MMRKASYAAVDRPSSNTRTPGSTPKHRFSSEVVEDLRTRNLKLAASVAQLKEENLNLRHQLKLYKRRSVILREQNALLIAMTKESAIQHRTDSVSAPVAEGTKAPVVLEPFTPIDACATKQVQVSVKRPILSKKKKRHSSETKIPPLIVKCFEADVQHAIPTTPFLEEDKDVASAASTSSLEGLSVMCESGGKEDSSRPRRTSVNRIVYKEPSLATKVRKGHRFFKSIDEEESKKDA